MSLRDEHLQQALKHAPDNGLEPSSMLREKVLDYASKAVKPRRESWLKRTMSLRVSSWQLAGMSSVAVALLVVVMVREQLPDESIWNVADVKDVAQNKVENKTEVQPKKVIEQDKHELLKKEERVDFTDAKPSIKEKAIADDAGLEVAGKNSHQEEAKTSRQLAEKAEIAAAPPQVVDKDNIAVAAPPEKKLATAAALPATVPASEAASVASTEQKNELERPAAGEITAGSAAKKTSILDEAKALGAAKANKDIQEGVLRILHLGNDWPTGKPLVDDVTGYRVDLMAGRTVNTEAQLAEQEAYNQAMREWYFAHKKSSD